MGPLAEPALIAARSSFLRFFIIAALATLLLLAAGCNGGDDKEASPSPSPSPTEAAPTPTPSPEPTPDPTFSSARALEHARQLSVVIGSRPAGSDAEGRAAQYIRDQLAGYGYASAIQEFPIDTVTDTGTNLALTAPSARAIEARALGGSTEGVAEGELVVAGIGRVEDFPVATGGKIALIERGELTFAMKVANATAAGAAGVVIYNNAPGIFAGGLTSGSSIPAASISQEDGQALAAGGPAAARLEVKTAEQTLTSRNVVAKPQDGTCEIVAGGHFDSVPAGPGANDNASGTAVVLEMARARAAGGQIDGVCYVLFGSEEIGLVGSAYYVGQLPAPEIDAIEAMLNFDMLAVGDTWPLIGSPEVTVIAAAEAQALGLPYRVSSTLPDNLGSDHASFTQAGVPSIIFNCFCDENYHTSEDRFEFIVESRLGEAGAMGMGMIDRLLAS